MGKFILNFFSKLIKPLYKKEAEYSIFGPVFFKNAAYITLAYELYATVGEFYAYKELSELSSAIKDKILNSMLFKVTNKSRVWIYFLSGCFFDECKIEFCSDGMSPNITISTYFRTQEAYSTAMEQLDILTNYKYSLKYRDKNYNYSIFYKFYKR